MSAVENAERALAAAVAKVETAQRHLDGAHESGSPAKIEKCGQHLDGARQSVAVAESELAAAIAAPPEVFVAPTESVQAHAGHASGKGAAT